MTTAERKLRLAQLLLQTEDEATLQAIEDALESPQQQVEHYWSKVSKFVSDNEVVSFGSRARGTQRAESDWGCLKS